MVHLFLSLIPCAVGKAYTNSEVNEACGVDLKGEVYFSTVIHCVLFDVNKASNYYH